ncbi:hypothetical protein CYFUS_000759 [Cystobacter fuscus]|uniref:Uncharacterized protein n=1 Tax=Cystobacter fuscus TaxID=43 RepID=A0A250IVW0_9BACT|nr:hypothetical protein [Cystobacter fuscus]ATB35347.1 hypothetical protein CYFUS_000759 [Cystobacter fuscus]
MAPVWWALAVVLLVGCATGEPSGGLRSGWGMSAGMGGSGGFSLQRGGAGEVLACGGVPMPAGWPDVAAGDAEALLAPLLKCPTPGDYVALQQRVDMPRLVEALDDWSAMRLAALGPVRADAVGVLNAKRVSFLLAAAERYGLEHAEVFTLYVLHTAHDDEVDGVLRGLARDKQLGRTLGHMPAVREELAGRGMPLSAYEERGEKAGDVLRGLGRAARDVLATSMASDGVRYMEMAERRGQLPAPYQDALNEVERELAWRHFAPGSVAVGSFDAATFGVPLGFFYLVVGTGEGLSSLTRGEYEQATRELAPAALVVGLYAGGRGVRALGEARGLGRLEARLSLLRELGRQWEERLGVEGARELLRDIRARREAAHFVAMGGADAALALREARGDVARAQVWLSQAKPPRAGGGTGSGSGHVASAVDGTGRPSPTRALAVERTGSMASLVDEAEGLTREVVEARLALVELDAEGPRLSRDVAVLERQRPSLEAPPPGAEGNPLWSEYVTYREKRLGELKQGKAVEGPLRWEGYERMRRGFAQGLAFESLMVDRLRADAALPRAERRFLGDFERPRIERWVGVWKHESGLRFADVLVIEEGPSAGRSPRVETFSFKSRSMKGLKAGALRAQIVADAKAALGYYGETLDIRRPSLRSLLREGSKVTVRRVRLIYEGGEFNPMKIEDLDDALRRGKVLGVEVSFQ